MFFVNLLGQRTFESGHSLYLPFCDELQFFVTRQLFDSILFRCCGGASTKSLRKNQLYRSSSPRILRPERRRIMFLESFIQINTNAGIQRLIRAFENIEIVHVISSPWLTSD